MQGRKKNRSVELDHSLKKLAPVARKERKPFQHMWSIGQQNKAGNYDALLDKNAHSYFTSQSIIKHCRQLESEMGRHEKPSSSNLRMRANLVRKRRQLKHQFANLDRDSSLLQNENHKIIPYTSTLKPCSKSKFEQLKKAFISKRILKQREHRQFLNTEYNTKLPERPEILIVPSLQPVGQLDFIKKCHNYRENGKQFTVLFRPRNSQSLKT